jgi:hypothetical protein
MMMRMTLFSIRSPPVLESSSGEDEQDERDCQDFIRESEALLESYGDKKSRLRLSAYTEDQWTDQTMEL